MILQILAPPSDRGSNNSGFYNLIGVLTHQGRSSSSGHYVGWTRDKLGKGVLAASTVLDSLSTMHLLVSCLDLYCHFL